MVQQIVLKYYHPELNIGLNNRKEVYLLSDPSVLLKAEVSRGNLVYRLPGSSSRTSYRQLKAGLIREVNGRPDRNAATAFLNYFFISCSSFSIIASFSFSMRSYKIILLS